ncbi:hypothetical protein [Desertivirga xinjiangensis]|uniref:hypothetical protein n=1 Tax=Desertivirga xinjiangensis TaxID=539206 RepID=UPI00210E0DC3|nr:hypothetical protein [Pedobacter xinjiangensis]
MKQFKIEVNGLEYQVEPSLHEGFYQLEAESLSGLIGKTAEGDWELSLPSGNAADLPAAEIGAAIERKLKVESEE